MATEGDGEEQLEATSPAEFIATDDKPPTPAPGTALCLSGGGYRATLFHLGAVWALRQSGVLFKLDRIVSASGGSLLAGLLALKWEAIKEEPAGQDDVFRREIVKPIFRLTSKTIDWQAAVLRLLRLHHIYDPIRATLDALYDKSTLQDMPDHPRFVITATNVQSGALWRFMKTRMRDWRVGDVEKPTLRLSRAVAASAAFPPFLSPVVLKLNPKSFVEDSGQNLKGADFRERIVLTDAGVYDNLAVETAWKKYDTVLISDAGWPLPPRSRQSSLWLPHTQRAIDILTHQISLIRQSQVKASFKLARTPGSENDPAARKGAYWGITSKPESYDKWDPYVSNAKRFLKIKTYPTRLKNVPLADKQFLVDWGFFVTKLAMKKYMSVEFPQNTPFGNLN